jgi:YHS domain-containing protein
MNQSCVKKTAHPAARRRTGRETWPRLSRGDFLTSIRRASRHNLRRLLRRCLLLDEESHPRAGYKSQGGCAMEKDTVCGMEVDEKQSKFHSEYEGKNFFFCSEECKDTFDSQPQNYAKQAA